MRQEEIVLNREYFIEQGRIGGKLGGKAAAANMTKKQRTIRALKAVRAREAKRAAK